MTFSPDALRGKRILVTGASSGIGRETAIALARAGWTVVLFARRASQLKETQVACPDPDAVMVVEGDVTKEDDIVRLFNTTVERYGKLLLEKWLSRKIKSLIWQVGSICCLMFARQRHWLYAVSDSMQNAGVTSVPLPLEDTPLTDFMNVLNTNLVGPFLCTREAIKIFKSQNPQGGLQWHTLPECPASLIRRISQGESSIMGLSLRTHLVRMRDLTPRASTPYQA